MGNDVWSVGFQQRLEILLEQHHLSKAEMARLCGLPSRTLENYFKGHKPGVEVLLSISRGLNVPVDWLLGDEKWQSDNFSHSEILSEAVWQAAHSYLKDIVDGIEAGQIIVKDGRIGSREPGQIAAAISANALQKFRALLSFTTKKDRSQALVEPTTDN